MRIAKYIFNTRVKDRTSLPELFCRKCTLRNLAKQQKAPATYSPLLQIRRPKACNFIKKETAAQAPSRESR